MARRVLIEDLQKLAESRGGKLLSQKYINDNTKLLWQCNEGHKWEAVPYSIKMGTWCPECYNIHRSERQSRRGNLEELKQIARMRGGDCLSTTYINNHRKAEWICKEGHIWMNTPSHVKNGEWCKICSDKRSADRLRGYRRSSNSRGLVEMTEYAILKGGKCLSLEYVDARTKLLWECGDGHRWEAVWDSVKHGSWCPKCSQNLHERMCKGLFEAIFKKEFPKTRPTWLINPKTNRKLELDGYCKELKLAFEYQGIQHFKEMKKFFHTEKNKRQFKEQVFIDNLKRRICEENGVNLVEIPYTIKNEELFTFILRECRKKGFKIPERIDLPYDYKDLDVYSPHKLTEMQKLAAKREGMCLSKNYVGNDVKLSWECQKGHIWEATPAHVKKGEWCPDCGGRKKLTIEDMHALAKSHGGECLSKEYKNAHIPLRWRCSKGHEWDIPSSNIRNNNSWCPKCGVERRSKNRIGHTIEEMRQIAESLGGKCLSENYINCHGKLRWRCSEGHEWDSPPISILSGSWCWTCRTKKRVYRMNKSVKRRRDTLEIMQKLAQQYGGICRSEEYINNNTKLLWRCSAGHEWRCKPSHIKSGHWCPHCAGVARSNIEEMQEIALSRGGKCLSNEYVNNKIKLLWECDKGHRWEAVPTHVKQGEWCPICRRIQASNKKRGTIEQMKLLAIEKGGECISSEYLGGHIKIKWRCKSGHEWDATPSSIKCGHWCPKCAGVIRSNIEEMKKFALLKGGHCLSQEYVNIDSKLLWKCSKGHEWKTTPWAIKSGQWCPVCAGNQRKNIEDIKKVAHLKGGECLSDTYINSHTPLRWRCQYGHEWISKYMNILGGSWCPQCAGKVKLKIEDMQELAHSHDGVCLSNEYINSKQKIHWKCKYGHEWFTVQSVVRNGSWCPYCANRVRLTIEDMQEVAKTRGGICLSKSYINDRGKLLWQCANGHQWYSTPSGIKRGRWCPECARNRR